METIENQGLNTYTEAKEPVLTPEEKIKGLEKKVEKLEKELDEKKQIIKNFRDFFTILAHDLRTPVTAILCYINLLHDKNGLSEENRIHFIKVLSDNSKRINSLLKNLMDWGKAQLENSKPYIEDVDIKSEMENIFGILEELARERGVTFKLESIGEINLKADKNMFNTVFRNLLSNAVRFSNEKEKVLVSVEQKDGLINISVKNNGAGIESKDIEKIFLLNEKKKDTRGEEGNGLGLYFCKTIIEKMGGNIQVESIKNQSTTFTVSLPLLLENKA